MVEIHTYDQEKFVNREKALTLIQEKLNALYAGDPAEKSELIHFWGMGGKGKTFLRNEVKRLYDSKSVRKENKSILSDYVIIDWNGDAFLNKTYSIPEMLIYFRNELARYGYKLEQFTKYITYYRTSQSASLPDLIDENEESISKSLFKGIFDVISQASLIGPLIGGIVDVAQTTSRKKEHKQLKEEYEIFSSFEAGKMLRVLLEKFMEDVHHELKDRKIIFMMDTFEDVRTTQMDWIFSSRTEFGFLPGLFYGIQPSLWIVFGRDEIDLHADQTSFQLKNFTAPETANYIQANMQQLPEGKTDQVISYSNGYPLLLSELHDALLRVQDSFTEEFFEQLLDPEKKDAIIVQRYKKYFTKEFNDFQNISVLRMFFAFRQWTIDREDMTQSDIYQFAQSYFTANDDQLQMIELESRIQQLVQLSFIEEVSSTPGEITYTINKTVYTAFMGETIDGIPVVPNALKQDVISFLLQRVTKKTDEALEVDGYTYIESSDNQAEVNQLIDLLFSLHEEMEPIRLYEKMQQLLQENNANASVTIFMQISLLERFSGEYLATPSGHHMLIHILDHLQTSGMVDYTDRFVHLLHGVHTEQALDERLGHYFLSIGRLSYAKVYLEKAIPALDTFKQARVYRATKETNVYNDPRGIRLDVQPAALIEGIQVDHAEPSVQDAKVTAYRKFLFNTRQLIRVYIEQGDHTGLQAVMLRWDIAISLDALHLDENVLYSAWLQMDGILMQHQVWNPRAQKEIEHALIPEIERNKHLVLEHPGVIITLLKMSNQLLEVGKFALHERLYDCLLDIILLPMHSEEKNDGDRTAFSEVIKSRRYSNYLLEKSIMLYPHFTDDENKKRTHNDVVAYYETRVAEHWKHPLTIGELLETSLTDLKVLRFLDQKKRYTSVVQQTISKVEQLSIDSFHLGRLYYLEGKNCLENGELRKSYRSFHKARNIIYDHLGSVADTSLLLIPYETYEIYTRFYLFQDKAMPMDDEAFEQFQERAQLNQTMIMNQYEEGLPDALQLYRMSTEVVEGIQSARWEGSYHKNIKYVTRLLDNVTEETFNQAVHTLGRHFFLESNEKFNREYLFYKEKYTPIPLNEYVQQVAQNAQQAWDTLQIPEASRAKYYEMAAAHVHDLYTKRMDYETFFQRYFMQLQNVFSMNSRQMNDVGKHFEEHAHAILDIHSKSYHQRNKILKAMIYGFQ